MNSGIGGFIFSILGRRKSEKNIQENDCKNEITVRESHSNYHLPDDDSDQDSSNSIEYKCDKKEKRAKHLGDTKIASVKKSVRQKIGEHLKTHKVCALYQTGSGIRIVLKKKCKKKAINDKNKWSDCEDATVVKDSLKNNSKHHHNTKAIRKPVEHSDNAVRRTKNAGEVKKDPAIVKLETKLQRVLEKLRSLENTNRIGNTSSMSTQILCNTFTQCSNEALELNSLSSPTKVSSHQRLPKPRLHKTWHFKPYRNNYVEHTCQTIYKRSNSNKKESIKLKFDKEEPMPSKEVAKNENYLFDDRLLPRNAMKSIEYKDTSEQNNNLTVSLLSNKKIKQPTKNLTPHLNSRSCDDIPNIPDLTEPNIPIRIMQLCDLMKPEDMNTFLNYCRSRPAREVKRKSSVQEYINNFNKRLEKEFNSKLGQNHRLVLKDITSKIPVKTLERPGSPSDECISFDSCVSNLLELEDKDSSQSEKENSVCSTYKQLSTIEGLPDMGHLALEPAPPEKEKELDINLSGFILQLEKLNVHNNCDKSKQVLETIKNLADCNRNLELLAHQFEDK